MDESSNVNCLSRSICDLNVNSYLWNDLNLFPCFLDTLKVLNFLLICKIMTIPWTCGALVVCLLEW